MNFIVELHKIHSIIELNEMQEKENFLKNIKF